jgi:ubiquinone biosynthesis O-methyltransferase
VDLEEAMNSNEQLKAQENFIDILVNLMDIVDPSGKNDYLRHESFHSQVSVFAELSNLVDSYINLKVLELGCGSGILSMTLAKMGFSVTTCDFFEETGQRLQNRLDQAGGNGAISFQQQNLEEDVYKLEREHYDVVIAVDVIEHVKNIKSIFNNTYNCLKPNGIFIVHTPNYARLNVRIKAFKNIFNPIWPILFEHYVKDDPYLGHVREFTPRELVELYDFFSFEVVVQRFPQGMTFGRVIPYYNRLLQIPLSLSWQVQEIARHFLPSLGPSQLVVGRKK